MRSINKTIAVISGFLCFQYWAISVYAFEEMPVSQELGPMDKPAINVGSEWHVVRNQEDIVETVVSIEGEVISLESTNGCKYKELGWGFAPSLEWSDCPGWEDGAQKITKSKGAPWPLNNKTKFQYSFRGNYSTGGGQPWRSKRKCKVKEQVRVKVPAGEYDTFKLECKDEWNKRTWWISPELRQVVAFKNKNGLMELTKP